VTSQIPTLMEGRQIPKLDARVCSSRDETVVASVLKLSYSTSVSIQTPANFTMLNIPSNDFTIKCCTHWSKLGIITSKQNCRNPVTMTLANYR